MDIHPLVTVNACGASHGYPSNRWCNVILFQPGPKWCTKIHYHGWSHLVSVAFIWNFTMYVSIIHSHTFMHMVQTYPPTDDGIYGAVRGYLKTTSTHNTRGEPVGERTSRWPFYLLSLRICHPKTRSLMFFYVKKSTRSYLLPCGPSFLIPSKIDAHIYKMFSLKFHRAFLKWKWEALDELAGV